MEKNILLLTLVSLSLVLFSATGSANEDRKPSYTHSEELFDYYKKGNSKTYDNWQDYYIVMRHLGFPNIGDYENESNLNFENPQALKQYIRELDNRNISTSDISSRRVGVWKQKSKQTQIADERNRKARFSELEKFKKKVFFKHIANELNSESNITRQVCFNVDRVALGFLDDSSAFISRKERKEIIAKKVTDVVSAIPLSSRATDSVQIDHPAVSCDALIVVNVEELKFLNETPEISSILTPEVARPNYFTPL